MAERVRSAAPPAFSAVCCVSCGSCGRSGGSGLLPETAAAARLTSKARVEHIVLLNPPQGMQSSQMDSHEEGGLAASFL